MSFDEQIYFFNLQYDQGVEDIDTFLSPPLPHSLALLCSQCPWSQALTDLFSLAIGLVLPISGFLVLFGVWFLLFHKMLWEPAARLLHVSVACCLSMPSHTHCVDLPQFVYSLPVGGHLGCFLWTLWKNGNEYLQTCPFWEQVFSFWRLNTQQCDSQLYGKCVLNFITHCHPVFQSRCTHFGLFYPFCLNNCN